jgi:hypothetical protein
MNAIESNSNEAVDVNCTADRAEATATPSGFTAGGAVADGTSENAVAQSVGEAAADDVSCLQGIDQFGDPDWSLIDDRRSKLPDFPTDVLSDVWQAWLQRASLGAGVSPDHVIVPMLGVASSLIGNSRRVRATKAWSEPMTLWSAVIGNSGDRKTPGLQVTHRALDVIDKNASSAVEQNRLNHHTRAQRSRESLKKWQAERKAALKAEPPRDPPPMPSEAIEPGMFVTPRTYVTDPTVRAVISLLGAKPRGVLVTRDELSGFFADMVCRGRSSRAFWIQAWDGKRYVFERLGSSIEIDVLLVGIVGGFQPDALARAFGAHDDGMDARFLFSWLSTPEYRPLSDDVLEVDPVFERALQALNTLLCEDLNGKFTPKDVPLSNRARQSFEDFRRFADQAKRELVGRESQWFAKGESQVLRLAGTLAYLAWSGALPLSGTSLEGIRDALEPETIGEKFVIAAVRLWRDYFWPHARAALHQAKCGDHHQNERRVLLWIKSRSKTEVSREDIRRDCLAQTLNASETQTVIEALERGHWLRKTITSTRGRPKYRWEVNPRLLGEVTGKTR